MIKVFYGEDRVRAVEAARRFLGEGYETIDAAELMPEDLAPIFQGATLFDTGERRILIRDFLANSAVSGYLKEFAGTRNLVAMLEMKVDKRSVAYKEAKDLVEFAEFKGAEKPKFVGFEIYRLAKRDGRAAVRRLEEIKEGEEPMMFLGVLVSAAMKDFVANPGGRGERKVLEELSVLDMQMKTTGVDPWLLIESFLVRLERN